MNRIVLLLVSSILLISCGKSEKKEPAALAPLTKEQPYYPPQSPQPQPLPPAQEPKSPEPIQVPVPTQAEQPCPTSQQPQPVLVGQPIPVVVGNAPCVPVVGGPVVAPVPVSVPVVVRAPAPGAPQDCYKVDPFICEVENRLLELMDIYRSSANILPFAGDFQIAFVARDCSIRQALAGVFAPCDLVRLSAIQQVEFTGEVFNPYLVAQNIATTDTSGRARMVALRLFEAMQADPVASANMLNPSYIAAGVGVANRNMQVFATVVFSQ